MGYHQKQRLKGRLGRCWLALRWLALDSVRCRRRLRLCFLDCAVVAVCVWAVVVRLRRWQLSELEGRDWRSQLLEEEVTWSMIGRRIAVSGGQMPGEGGDRGAAYQNVREVTHATRQDESSRGWYGLYCELEKLQFLL